MNYKKKILMIFSLICILFLDMPLIVKADTDTVLLSSTTFTYTGSAGTIDKNLLETSTNIADFEGIGKGTHIFVADTTASVGTSVNLYMPLTYSNGFNTGGNYPIDLVNTSKIVLTKFNCLQGYDEYWLYSIKKDGSLGVKWCVFIVNSSTSVTVSKASVLTSSGVKIFSPPVSNFDISDISAYPVGTVKIVQPKNGSMFQSGITTSIDFEVWGKIPININDSKFSGISENLWLTNALKGPINSNAAIYIDGVEDRLGTGIGIDSKSLGDSYGLQILGNVDEWKKAGYYCFKYKFTYSPELSKTVSSVKFGVSPITSWSSGYLFGDNYAYTYYSDSLDIKVDTFIDYNNDGKDDVTGQDLTDLNDNSSSVGLDKNASIAETMEYYTNKFYDGITSVIKTPFNMLESSLNLGNQYLIKMTNILAPVSDNFKKLLTFVPDDIMTCIWGIIVCRLSWTALRSFIAMLTKR